MRLSLKDIRLLLKKQKKALEFASTKCQAWSRSGEGLFEGKVTQTPGSRRLPEVPRL